MKKNWQPEDYIVMTLSMCVGVVMIVPLFLGQPLSDQSAEIYKSMIIAVVAIVSLYIGNKLRK